MNITDFSSEESAILFDKLKSAAAVLERQIGGPSDETHIMAAIQAFEFCYELGWKWLKSELEGQGLNAVSPREVFRLSGQAGLIDSVELWISFLQQRNLTSHTYQEATAKIVYEFVKATFAPEIKTLLGP